MKEKKMTREMKVVAVAAAMVGAAVGGPGFVRGADSARPLADATSASLPDLRGFGRVAVERSEEGGVSAFRFECDTPGGAETVAGKFLWDLGREPDVASEGGVFTRPGGASFAVVHDGKRTTVLAAESRETLEGFLAQRRKDAEGDGDAAGASGTPAGTAACPPWMKRFGWGMYGMGGFENIHDWMGRNGAAKDEILDPAQDFGFLAEMGAHGEPVHFDNWLDEVSLDFSDGIIDPAWIWRAREARAPGTPMSWRCYVAHDVFNAPFGMEGWMQRRSAGHAAQPPRWLGCSRARANRFGAMAPLCDEEWFKYGARRVKDAMSAVRDGSERGWMHPVGELAGNAPARLHQDWGPAARESWSKWLVGNGFSPEEAAATPIPEFATFAGLGGLALDLTGRWLTRPELGNSPDDKAWWKKPPEERYPGVAGRWFAEDADLSGWTETENGSWEFAALYPESKDRDGLKIDRTGCTRWFRKTFVWDPAKAGAGRVWFYFFPLAGHQVRDGGHPPRNAVYVNGGKAGEIGKQWGALDVTDLLRGGGNTVAIHLQGAVWTGRAFLSTEPPESYPFSDPAKNRLWALWNGWRNAAFARIYEIVFDAMRQVDPDAPVKMMAPNAIGRPFANALAREWGGWPHFTGEGSWFYPWNKRYGRLWGLPATSELAGPAKGGMSRSALRVFGAGLDGHEPVFTTQTYSRNAENREWCLARKEMLGRLGTFDIDLGGPQVLLYRRSALCDEHGTWPDPYPDAPNAAGRNGAMESLWNHDWGRSTLQSLGQSPLYIDDDGLAAGKMRPYPLVVDCGNEVIPPAEAEALARWVDAGGTFVALPCTGRSTPPEDAAPVRALLARAKGGAPGGDGACRGRVIVLDGETMKSLDDEGGRFTPKPTTLARVGALLRRVGFPEAVAAFEGAPDRDLWVQPYRSNSGLDAVAVVCNWHGDGKPERAASDGVSRVLAWRLPNKPAKIVRYAKGGATDVEFDWADGVARLRVDVPGTEVQVFNAVGAFGPGDAFAWWWADQTLKWPATKKPSIDFEPYGKGGWKDPTQELKYGWTASGPAAPGGAVPFDVLQFWGVPKGEGATLSKRFDLDDASWSAGGRTWLVCGARFGTAKRNFLSPCRVTLNGKTVIDATDATSRKARHFVEVTGLLKERGNELVAEVQGGEDYTGMIGVFHLWHRDEPVESLPLHGTWTGRGGATLALPGAGTVADATFAFHVPAEWKGRSGVRLWMEGAKVPLGVRVNGSRYVKGHDSNFTSAKDLDITDFLEFGATNTVTLGHKWNAGPMKLDVKEIRLDVFENR